MTKISAALIVKNESRCIERCLLSIIHAVDEIVIVDTGSTDDTVKIIQKLMDKYQEIKLYYFEWCNDFSAARNYSLSKVTGDWVLIMDADDYLNSDPKEIKKIIKKFDRLNYPVALNIKYTMIEKNIPTKTIEQGILRIFPTKYNLKYEGKVHETISESLKRHPNQKIVSTHIELYTDGYDSELVDQSAKMKRNILLLNEMLEKDPENGLLLFYLARETAHFNSELANMILQEAIKRIDPKHLPFLHKTLKQ